MRQIVEQIGYMVGGEVYLGPGPIEDGARVGGGITELRRGEEALANADEAVRRRGTRLVTELLCAGL